MTLLNEFKWIQDHAICCICDRPKSGWMLQTKLWTYICLRCCASITTMHNLKEDKIK